MFVYGYPCLCMDTRVCVWIPVCVCGCPCLCMDTHVCVWIPVFVYGFPCLCMVCMYVCTCVCMYVCRPIGASHQVITEVTGVYTVLATVQKNRKERTHTRAHIHTSFVGGNPFAHVHFCVPSFCYHLSMSPLHWPFVCVCVCAAAAGRQPRQQQIEKLDLERDIYGLLLIRAFYMFQMQSKAIHVLPQSVITAHDEQLSRAFCSDWGSSRGDLRQQHWMRQSQASSRSCPRSASPYHHAASIPEAAMAEKYVSGRACTTPQWHLVGRGSARPCQACPAVCCTSVQNCSASGGSRVGRCRHHFPSLQHTVLCKYLKTPPYRLAGIL